MAKDFNSPFLITIVNQKDKKEHKCISHSPRQVEDIMLFSSQNLLLRFSKCSVYIILLDK